MEAGPWEMPLIEAMESGVIHFEAIQSEIILVEAIQLGNIAGLS